MVGKWVEVGGLRGLICRLGVGRWDGCKFDTKNRLFLCGIYFYFIS